MDFGFPERARRCAPGVRARKAMCRSRLSNGRYDSVNLVVQGARWRVGAVPRHSADRAAGAGPGGLFAGCQFRRMCRSANMASRAEPTTKPAPAPSRGNIRLSLSRAGAHIPAPQKFQLPLQRVDPMIEIIDAGGVECGFISWRRHQDGIGGNGVSWRAESSVGRFHPGCSQRWRQQTRINELASPSNTNNA
jgi:hypothetical protein